MQTVILISIYSPFIANNAVYVCTCVHTLTFYLFGMLSLIPIGLKSMLLTWGVYYRNLLKFIIGRASLVIILSTSVFLQLSSSFTELYLATTGFFLMRLVMASASMWCIYISLISGRNPEMSIAEMRLLLPLVQQVCMENTICLLYN